MVTYIDELKINTAYELVWASAESEPNIFLFYVENVNISLGW